MNDQLVVNNLLISYTHKKISEQGNVLLFLHGWRSNKEVWNQVVTKIEQEHLNVKECYAIDLPGFGASQSPVGAFTVGDYAGVVVNFINKLALQHVILVGHSFGGRVGIKVAAKFPMQIEKLVLVDSAGFVTKQTRNRVMELGAKLVKPFFLPPFMQRLRRKIYKLIDSDDYVATPWLTKTYINIKSEDLSVDMKKVNCQTLIIFGQNDNDTPVEFGQRMKALIKNSQLEIIANAEHFSFIDQSEVFIKILKTFLHSL